MKTYADLLEAASKSVRIQEAAGVEPMCKCDGRIDYVRGFNFASKSSKYEFPATCLEGKNVWKGNTIYHKGIAYVVLDGFVGRECLKISTGTWMCSLAWPADFSWLPPKQEPAIPEGFTRWGGGECPVDGRLQVEVIFGGGGKNIDASDVFLWIWTNSGCYGDIIAYRVIKPATVMVELKMSDKAVLNEVVAERARQDEKWGGAQADDARKTPEEWCNDVEAYVVWARQMHRMGSPDKYRRRMLQIATMAVAACGSFDRKALEIPTSPSSCLKGQGE